MAKQKAKTATPKLRFPEFRQEPQWLISKLGTHGRFIGGGTPSRENAQFWAGTHPWISSSDIAEEEIRPVRPSRFITDEAVAQSATQAVPAGSVLIVARVGVGKIAVSEELLHTSQDFANLVPGSDAPTFLAYLLKSRKSDLLALNQGMAIKGFTRDDIAGLDVPVPAKAEQQKIADCLTSLDEVIAAQGRKVEALKAHKRGLMQQLFPREGETRPRLRFPEFRNAPEWKWTTLNRVCDMQAGKFVSASEISDEPGEGTYSCYGGNGLRGFTKSFTHSGVFPLIGRQGALCGNVQFAKGEFHATEHALVATPQAGVNVTWLYYTLGKLELNKYATGQAQPGLSVDVLKSVECSVPATETEQKRIADCLASLDTRITAEAAHLAALKTHKQGLMQQLFPAPEAMNA